MKMSNEYLEGWMAATKKLFKTLNDIKNEIGRMKREQNSLNVDYKTGFICALSNVEGYIAKIESRWKDEN